MTTNSSGDPMEKNSHGRSEALGGLSPAELLKQGAAEDTMVEGGQAFEPPSLEELAEIFPQFEVMEFVGKGGMGAVYKVRQKELDRVVALKILPPDIGEGASFAGRFAREAKALAKLNHPGIVTIHEFGQSGGLYFIVMEFVDGVNLRQLLRNGRISAREALAIVPQICDALQFAHDQGIVHRDIKPENLLLDRLGRVKVADFGLAKLAGGDGEAEGGAVGFAGESMLTEAGKVMGTPPYMAPEQHDRPGEVDHRADIYALGVVFYQMLTGELPGGKIEAPSRKVKIDVRLDEVVLRALEADPEMRFQQASVMKTRVEAAGGATVPGSRRWDVDYRSKARWLGWPLLHVTSGLDPETGRERVAKGIVAIGGRAKGVVAFGGVATGGVAFGGVAAGVVAFGGLALGLFAYGGVALALLAALGGLAVGWIAIGGGALGYQSFGGTAGGVHTLDGRVQDEAAMAFFLPWAREMMMNIGLIHLAVMAFMLLVGFGVPLWLVRKKSGVDGGNALERAVARKERGWAGFRVALGVALGLVLFAMFDGWRHVENNRRQSALFFEVGTATPEGEVRRVLDGIAEKLGEGRTLEEERMKSAVKVAFSAGDSRMGRWWATVTGKDEPEVAERSRQVQEALQEKFGEAFEATLEYQTRADGVWGWLASMDKVLLKGGILLGVILSAVSLVLLRGRWGEAAGWYYLAIAVAAAAAVHVAGPGGIPLTPGHGVLAVVLLAGMSCGVIFGFAEAKVAGCCAWCVAALWAFSIPWSRITTPVRMAGTPELVAERLKREGKSGAVNGEDGRADEAGWRAEGAHGQALERAKRDLDWKRKEYEAGIVDKLEMEAAEDRLALLEARLAGDGKRAAEAGVFSAKRRLEGMIQRQRAGLVRASEVEEARRAAEEAEAGWLAERYVELELAAADARAVYLERAPERVEAEARLEAFLKEHAGFPDERSREIILRRKVELLEESGELSKRYGSRHPRIVAAKGRLEALDRLRETGGTLIEKEAGEVVTTGDLPEGNRFQIRKVSPDDPAAEKMMQEVAGDDGEVREIELRVGREVIVWDRHVAKAGVSMENGETALNLGLDEAGARRLADATKEAKGDLRLAIVIDGKVVTAPVVQTALGANLSIKGTMGREALLELIRHFPGWEKEVKGVDAYFWLMKIDREEHEASYADLAEIARGAAPFPQWRAMLANFRTPLGVVIFREMKEVEELKSLPGMPEGEYRVITFGTDFANKKGAVETVSLIREEDGSWKPAGYFVR